MYLEIVHDIAKYFLISFVVSAIFIVPLINLLYKIKFIASHKLMKNGFNKIFFKINKDRSKIGTPSLGGILMWIVVPALWLLLFDNPFARALALVFFLIGLYGFIDEVFTQFFIKRSDKYRLLSESFGYRIVKLLTMFGLFLFVSYIAVHFLGITTASFFGLTIPLNGIMLFVLAFFMLASSYATELVDGVDGLSTGLFILTIIGFIFLNLALPQHFQAYGIQISSLLSILLGSFAVYLYFNIPPARVFMGSPGAFPMGSIFLLVALYSGTLEAFVFFMLIYYLDTATSFLQILSFKLRKKRLFPIAPIHHFFQHLGWPDAKVTMRAWLLQGLLVMIGVFVGTWA